MCMSSLIFCFLLTIAYSDLLDYHVAFSVAVLLLQPSENLYDQKPEEPALLVPPSTNTTNPKAGTSFTSRFEYVDNVQSTELISGGPQVINHVSPPKSSSFFAEFGIDSGFQRKSSSNSSKQVNFIHLCCMQIAHE